jgi:hypothetical protein
MTTSKLTALTCWLVFQLALGALAQGVQPYPNAITDRVVRQETWMAPPPVNTVFQDPDFGSQMVRATDETTLAGSYLRSAAAGDTNMWSANSRKFYVIGEGGLNLAFAFDPSTMTISSLPGANKGEAFVLPFRPGPMFSFIDSDLAYGTTDANRFTISQYRFSTNEITPLLDTTTCGLQPPLDVNNPKVQSDDDVSLSFDDNRIALSEGAPDAGDEPFIVVYDKNLGCRWYNTQTGQVGGQWGPIGYANASGFLIDHARLSGNGRYVQIVSYGFGSYFWDLETLNVTPCQVHTSLDCSGYGALGRSSYVNAAGTIDEMNIVKRPVDDLAAMTPLVWPLLEPYAWEQEKHFSWVNGSSDDNRPICSSVYAYGWYTITRAWDDEIVCIETDGLASTVWRFAHHRAYPQNEVFNTQPLGNVSPDGRFFLFTSTWDYQLGTEPDGTTRSDVWIVKLK